LIRDQQWHKILGLLCIAIQKSHPSPQQDDEDDTRSPRDEAICTAGPQPCQCQLHIFHLFPLALARSASDQPPSARDCYPWREGQCGQKEGQIPFHGERQIPEERWDSKFHVTVQVGLSEPEESD
jgi:hypothetical protein